MRQLWSEHVGWSRNFIIDTIAGLPEASMTTQHLLASQSHFGETVFKPLYGDATAAQLTGLLNKHISDEGNVIIAAKSGDKRALATAKSAAYANADDIAKLLAQVNPSWSLADLTAHWRAHLDFTLGEATARLNEDWANDVFGYELVETHALTLADFMTTGLATQFPDKIGPDPSATRDEEVHVAMRKLWSEHALWTRVYLVDQTSKLPDASFAQSRLLKNQDDIGNVLKPFYGEASGNELAALLRNDVNGTIAVLMAMQAGDKPAIGDAKAAWYLNSDQIAQFLANKNPHWPLADAQALMRHHLDLTLGEVNARLAQNWQWDIVYYEAVVVHIFTLSDFLADGIAQQFLSVPLSGR